MPPSIEIRTYFSVSVPHVDDLTGGVSIEVPASDFGARLFAINHHQGPEIGFTISADPILNVDVELILPERPTGLGPQVTPD